VKATVAAPLTIAGVLALAMLGTFGLAVADLRHDPVTMQLWPWVGRLWTGLCGFLPLIVAAGLCYGTVQLARLACSAADAGPRRLTTGST
jgi:hypothetical protein